MAKQLFLFLFLVAIVVCACGDNAQNKKAKELFHQDRGIGSFNDKLSLPIDINGNIDTINTAKIKFAESGISFDTIKESELFTASYHFTNIGNKPLYILDVQTSCGCTIPEFSKGKVDTNESGTITAKFDSKDRSGDQNKTITVFTNTYPNKTELSLFGFVKK